MLYAFVKVPSEEQRQHIGLTGTHQMAIAGDVLDNHIEMESIRQVGSEGVIHTLMQLMGSKPDCINQFRIVLLV
jgi:hypothetical protein